MFREKVIGQMFAALSATNEAVLRTSSPEHLYRSVCQAAVDGGGFVAAAILLAQSDRELHPVAGAGVSYEVIRRCRIDTSSSTAEGRGLAGEAFRTGKAIVTNDFQSDPRLELWRDLAVANEIRAAAAVPIKRRGCTAGVMLVYLGEQNAITSDVVVLLERMTDNIRFALENFDKAEELRSIEHARNRLSCMYASLSAMNEAVLRAKTLDEMFGLVCDAASDGGRMFGSAIFLRHENSTNLQLVACAGRRNHLFQEVCLPYGSDGPALGLHGPALRTGKPVICLDPRNDLRTRPWIDLIIKGGVTSLGFFPLFRRERAIGVFLFSCRDTDAFQQDSESLDLMARMAQNITFGIDMFAEHAERDKLSRMLGALSDTNEAILRAKSRDELYHLVCEASARGGQFNSTTIFVANSNKDHLEVVASLGPVGDHVRELKIPLRGDRPEVHGLAPSAFRTGKCCVINEFQRDERTAFWAKQSRRIGSGASFPLRVGDDDFGVLLFLSAESGTFTPDFVELLERLAGSVSLALEKFKKADEKRLADEKVAYLASHDLLTGLPNRATFAALLRNAIEKEERAGGRFALLFIDLDRFKIVNDSLGHEAGDRLLVEMARRLKTSLGDDDVVARLGGDEFVAIVREDDTRSIEEVVSKLLDSIAAPMRIGEHSCYTTASIGISLFPEHGADDQTLLRNSDAAMYRVKMSGKNGFWIADGAVESPPLQPQPSDQDERRSSRRGRRPSLA
jgi:diguanylate cyclase (GGDEF)-like protein